MNDTPETPSPSLDESAKGCRPSSPCSACGGSGIVLEGEQGAQYSAPCEACAELKPLTGEMTPERDARIRVTLRCPACKSEQRCARHSSDPANCAVIELTCPKCYRDGDRQLLDYFDAAGDQIDCDGNFVARQNAERSGPAAKDSAT